MASEGAIIPQLVESITQSSSPSTATCSVPMAGGDISSSAHTIIPCHTEVVLDEKTKKELFTDTFCRVCGAVLQFESHRNAHYEGKRHAQKVRLYFLNKELEEMAYKRKVDQKIERNNSHVDPQLAQDKNKFCSLCRMAFTSPVAAQSHYVGKIHTKRVRQLFGETSECKAEVSDSSMTALAEAAVAPVGEQNAVASSLSEKSNQQEASTEPSSADNEVDLTDPNKYCKLCCASFNNPMVAQQHYNGKKHVRNELRRKLMEEMEDTGLPVDSGGEGVYACPICSITLTSIEMYQSHMQGNKHQIKENIVAHLMKTTKKTYNSFENELEDYIKVQKARGLEPKTQFRTGKDQQDSAEETEIAPMHPNPNPAAYKYFGPRATPYPSYNPLHASDPRMAGWEQTYRPQKPPRMPVKTAPPRKHPPSSPDSSDYSSSDDSSGSHKKEKRPKREHRSKERKHHSKSKRENESIERKKRKIEETDSGKEDSEKEKKSEASVDKSKHKKEKKDKLSIDKESKKHKKPKKVEDQRTEEEMLWDESILGF